MGETIVVGFDDKEPARRALDRAAQEARETGGRLLVVAIAEVPLDPRAPRNFGTLGDGRVPHGRLLEPPDVAAALASARERLQAAGLSGEYAWAPGEPARILVDMARDSRARLIVIGGHHESLLGGLFHMSVADGVKREAGCEVLVVP
jgi:nucleotide-binding universal stress UspA family protein